MPLPWRMRWARRSRRARERAEPSLIGACPNFLPRLRDARNRALSVRRLNLGDDSWVLRQLLVDRLHRLDQRAFVDLVHSNARLLQVGDGVEIELVGEVSHEASGLLAGVLYRALLIWRQLVEAGHRHSEQQYRVGVFVERYELADLMQLGIE